MTTKLSQTDAAVEWLENFEDKDRDTAVLLLDSIMLVGASEFASKINAMLQKVAVECEEAGEVIAFYAEREVEKDDKTNQILPYFPHTETGRAEGGGVELIKTDLEKQDVGSEGIVAAMITKICAKHKYRLPHPGPDALRNNKVRRIVLVTDIIGSGRRISSLLDALYCVASIRSWHSFKLIKFDVVCYSATEHGLQSVRSHSTEPNVHVHVACPTIDETFEGEELGRVKFLCKSYPKKNKYWLGFNHTGSLIAFSHGLPNNAPAILHSDKNGWKPLFIGRSTVGANIDGFANTSRALRERSEKTLKIRTARETLLKEKGKLWVHSFMALVAIKKGHRTLQSISARTQLPLSDVKNVIDLMKEAKWITDKNTLTALGRRELRWLKRRDIPEEKLVTDRSVPYFPTQLRAL